MQHKYTWYIWEKQNGLWILVRKFHNLITNYGLTALSSAPSPSFVNPSWMVIDSAFATLTANYSSGSMEIVATSDVMIGNDTSITVGAGLATQEDVPVSSNVGGGDYILDGGGLVNNHSSGEYIVRTPTFDDTIASVISEAQFDPTFFPNQRPYLSGTYSPDVGQTILQFFIAGTQAHNVFFGHVGLTDNVTIGQGNLHNYATLGYMHNAPNDFEVDILHTVSLST